MIFSDFWWGWLYGTVLTFVGMLIIGGGYKWWNDRRTRRLLTTYSAMQTHKFFDRLRDDESDPPRKFFDQLPYDNERDKRKHG